MTARIRLRRDQLDEYMRHSGIATESDLADRMNVAKSSVYRILMNRVSPGEKSIAGLLVTFDAAKARDISASRLEVAAEMVGLDPQQFQRAILFADLFEVITEEAA